MLLYRVPPLWQPLASRVSTTWRRCTVEAVLARSRHWNETERKTKLRIGKALGLSVCFAESRQVLSQPRFVSWLLQTQNYPHAAWLLESAARCGFVETVRSIVAHEATQKGTRKLLNLLDGGILGNIAFHSGGVDTLERLCTDHGIECLDRRNMAWTITAAVVAGDSKLLQFLARMRCPYDITTALAVHVLGDTRTAQLFGITSDMLSCAADVAERVSDGNHWEDAGRANGCLLTLLALLIRRWARKEPLALAHVMVDGVRFGAALGRPRAWIAPSHQKLATSVPQSEGAPHGTTPRFDWPDLDYDWISTAGYGPPPTRVRRSRVLCGLNDICRPFGTNCGTWYFYDVRTITMAYGVATTGNASISNHAWIPPLFERWREREPALCPLFRYLSCHRLSSLALLVG